MKGPNFISEAQRLEMNLVLKAPNIGVGNDVGIDVENIDVETRGLGGLDSSHLLACHPNLRLHIGLL